MSEIDPVTLELLVKNGQYRANLKSDSALTQREMDRMGKSVQRLEAQMQRSSGAIGASLRGLAGTLGTYFTGRELVGLIDGFTRLQNSLRVAGLEGAKLESVQASLLDLSTKYGVGIEGLANLYGKATDAGRSFGASEGEILQLTEATSQALLITGTNAQQASGAILGLSQALASGTVRAEEYNQINEGGLRPLLQAAAATEKYGGDINKLRTAVLAGKVSSQEFFNAIQAGSAQLAGQASEATLTLSGAFEALTSRLTVYIGQSAQANGVTQALAGAMQLLAENLDTIIPVLAVIGTALGVGFVTNAVRARIAAIAAAGAMTTLGGAARGALALLGGPVGLAITAVAAGLGYLEAKSRDTSASLDELRSSLSEAEGRLEDARKQAQAAGITVEKLGNQSDNAASSINTFSGAVWASVNAMTSAAAAAKNLTLAKLALSTAEAKNQIAQLSPRAKGQAEFIRRAKGGRFAVNEEQVADLNVTSEKLNVAAATIRANRETESIIRALGDKFVEPKGGGGNSSVGDGKKPKGSKGSKGPSGPSISDINDRFESELASIAQQTISARQSLATSAEDRAELELRAVEAARVEALRSLSADKDYSEAQKARVKDALDNLAEFERERIARDLRVQKDEELADIADTQFRAQSDALRQQYDLAKSQTERRDLAYEIIALEYRERDAALERIKNNEDLSKAVRDRATIEQAALRESQGRTMEQARRDTAGPLENYFDNAKKTADELNEAYQELAVDGIRSVTDELANAATGFLNLGGVAGRILNQIIADFIRLQIQQATTSGSGFLSNILSFASTAIGGGGASGSSLGGGLGGLASGGYAEPHSVHRVNEQGGGVELLRMGSQGGTVIPLGQVNAQASRGSSAPTVIQPIINVDARGAVMNDQFAKQILARADQTAAGYAASMGKTVLKAVPGRLEQYQSDGT